MDEPLSDVDTEDEAFTDALEHMANEGEGHGATVKDSGLERDLELLKVDIKKDNLHQNPNGAGDSNPQAGDGHGEASTETTLPIGAKETDEDDDSEDEEKQKDAEDDESKKDEDAKIEEALKERDAKLSEDEILEFTQEADKKKVEGNQHFTEQKYDEAIECYTEALRICPLSDVKKRSILYSNRAACKLHQESLEGAIKDCSKALELHPVYMKALLRRADLYEKTEKLDEALTDYQKALEMDPSLHEVRLACVRLPEEINTRNEKMKEEMMGKLKDLGNLVLRPFGLSTSNFQFEKNPETGSYSVNFQQNAPQPAPGNGRPANTQGPPTQVPQWASDEQQESTDDEGSES